MHARDLVEVAVIVVTHADSFSAVEERRDELTTVWSRYWTVSRCRLDRWQQLLPPNLEKRAPSTRSVAEEILTSEILTRVWTALLCFPHHADRGEREPIARNIFLAHQESRNRVLKLLAHPDMLSNDDAVALNRLRRRCERWTDLLLAYLSRQGDVDEFAFDPERVHDFANDLREDGMFECRGESWLMLLASLRNAFQQGYCSSGLNADLNKQIASLTIRCFPTGSMGDVELAGSMWQMRLERLTWEAEGLVEELFQLDQMSPAPLRRAPFAK